MTCHYPDLGSASYWSCRKGNLLEPIKSTIQIWVVTRRHQYKISALIPQTSFIRRETRGGVYVAKGRLFYQAVFEEKVVSTLNFAVLHNKTVLSKTVLQARAKTGNIRTPLRDYLWKRLRENSNKEQYKLRLS